MDNLCLAGGVALNCSANGLIAPPIYVPPFPHDAGVALGSAWSVNPPVEQARSISAFLGAEAGPLLELREDLSVSDTNPSRIVDLLEAGAVGAVVNGRAEVGPRALGHRSIIAIPGSVAVKDQINGVKSRETWRPFGGVTLEKHRDLYWCADRELSRYMIGAGTVTPCGRRDAPAVVHVDGTTRPQWVESGTAPVMESLLEELEKRGMPPVLLNTSFNGRDQPIVQSSAEALATSDALRLDFLIIDDLVYRPRPSVGS